MPLSSSRPPRHPFVLLLLFVVCCSTRGGSAGGPQRASAGHPPPHPGELACPAYDAATLPAALPVLDPPVAGTAAGSFSVSSEGQARYTIPLVVPPGRLGMEPKLSVVYDSSSGDGPLGVGFSVQGLSAIARCPKTIARDGVVEEVLLDGTDPLCLDGLTDHFRQTLAESASKYSAFQAALERFDKV